MNMVHAAFQSMIREDAAASRFSPDSNPFLNLSIWESGKARKKMMAMTTINMLPIIFRFDRMMT